MVPIDYGNKNLVCRLKACGVCHRVTLHVRPTPNHWLHFGLTLLTGLWGLVWLVLALQAWSKWFLCTECHN